MDVTVDAKRGDRARVAPSVGSVISTRRRQHLAALLLTAPLVLLFLIFIGYGIGYNIVASFLTTSLRGVTTFAGLRNYAKLIHDDVFYQSLLNNCIWFVVTVGIMTSLGYGLALALDAVPRMRRYVKAIFFIPAMFAPAVIGLVWAQVLSPYGGLLSDVSGWLHLGLPEDWLGSKDLAIYSVAAVSIWQWTGFSVLICVAAVQNVPPELREAAMLDGARYRRIVRSVILPLTRPALAILLILGVIGSLQTFALIFVMTEGGPGNASQVLGTYIFQQAFENGNFNYGAALGVVLLLITLCITVIQVHLFRRNWR